MISAFTNIFKIPELRQRILFTIGMLVIVRAGAAITIPGVNAHVLNEWFQSSMSKSAGGGVAALFNIFAGGALEHCAVFSLGIMPYISASIMMQLLTAVIPRLNKLAREDGGARKSRSIRATSRWVFVFSRAICCRYRCRIRRRIHFFRGLMQ
jgi:preprotein translocase subunit SecY